VVFQHVNKEPTQRSTVLLEKLTHLDKKFPEFMELEIHYSLHKDPPLVPTLN
jgi:hypothetical protein